MDNVAPRHTSVYWFLIPAALVYAAAFAIVDSLPKLSAPTVVATGLTVDLLVVVPALYYFVVVRRKGLPAISVVPIFILSFLVASWLIPDTYQQSLNYAGYLIPLAEIIVVGYVGTKALRLVRVARRTRKTRVDFLATATGILDEAFGVPRLSRAVAFELSLFHYAFSRGSRSGEQAELTYHNRSGYGAVLSAILMATLVELVAVFFLIRMWSPVAAGIHTALSLYAVIWFIGDYRAMRMRPHRLTPTGMQIRCGLRWSLDVDFGHIAAVARSRKSVQDSEYLGIVPFGDPRYVIELRSAQQATGPYGITKQVRYVGLIVDDQTQFELWLRQNNIPVS